MKYNYKLLSIILLLTILCISSAFATSKDLILESRHDAVKWESGSFYAKDEVVIFDNTYYVLSKDVISTNAQPPNLASNIYSEVKSKDLTKKTTYKDKKFKDKTYYNGDVAVSGDLTGLEISVLDNKLVGLADYQQTNPFTVTMYVGTDGITYSIYSYHNETNPDNLNQDHLFIRQNGVHLFDVVSEDGFIEYQTAHFSTQVASIPDQTLNYLESVTLDIGDYFTSYTEDEVFVWVPSGSSIAGCESYINGQCKILKDGAGVSFTPFDAQHYSSFGNDLVTIDANSASYDDYVVIAVNDGSDFISDSFRLIVQAVQDPEATTYNPTNVGTTSAQLNGAIQETGGSSVDYGFEYRVVGAGNWTTNQVGTSSAEASYFLSLTNLTSSTNYEYRAYVDDGTRYYGTTKTFTTLTTGGGGGTDSYDFGTLGSSSEQDRYHGYSITINTDTIAVLNLQKSITDDATGCTLYSSDGSTTLTTGTFVGGGAGCNLTYAYQNATTYRIVATRPSTSTIDFDFRSSYPYSSTNGDFTLNSRYFYDISDAAWTGPDTTVAASIEVVTSYSGGAASNPPTQTAILPDLFIDEGSFISFNIGSYFTNFTSWSLNYTYPNPDITLSGTASYNDTFMNITTTNTTLIKQVGITGLQATNIVAVHNIILEVCNSDGCVNDTFEVIINDVPILPTQVNTLPDFNIEVGSSANFDVDNIFSGFTNYTFIITNPESNTTGNYTPSSNDADTITFTSDDTGTAQIGSFFDVTLSATNVFTFIAKSPMLPLNYTLQACSVDGCVSNTGELTIFDVGELPPTLTSNIPNVELDINEVKSLTISSYFNNLTSFYVIYTNPETDSVENLSNGETSTNQYFSIGVVDTLLTKGITLTGIDTTPLVYLGNISIFGCNNNGCTSDEFTVSVTETVYVEPVEPSELDTYLDTFGQQGSTVVRLIIGLIIIFGMLLAGWYYTRTLAISFVSGLMGLIISVAVGLISIWLVLLIILIALIPILYKVVFGPRGG